MTVHPPSLIRVFAVRIKKAWVLSYPLSAQPHCWFCHVVAPILNKHLRHIMTKPKNYLCSQRRLRSAWASAQSLLSAWRNLRRLIRLGGCPGWGWSETSLGAQAIFFGFVMMRHKIMLSWMSITKLTLTFTVTNWTGLSTGHLICICPSCYSYFQKTGRIMLQILNLILVS